MPVQWMVFNYWLLLIPLLTACVGWAGIRLATLLLFRPFVAWRAAGITVQGIFSRKQQQIALAAGKVAATEFGAVKVSIEQSIGDRGRFAQIRPLIEAHIDDFLRNRLKEQMPMIGMLIGDKTIQSLKIIFIAEIESLFPQVMNQFAGRLLADIDMDQLIHDKIVALEPQKVEAMCYPLLKKAFGKAARFGFLLGLLVGLLQLLIIWMLL